MTAIRKHVRDFVAILILLVIAAAVSSYILANQRLTLPAWVPIVGKDFFTLKGEFETAQAVTPGQGQTVNIAGVPVGEIAKVELVEGKALVTMKLENRYADVYPNATMLLRPKTGLKDMTVEMEPGTRDSGPKLKEGDVISVSQTAPDVNLDEILASLDGDSRDYLRLLINGAGQGLKGNSKALAATFKRFDPTARYLKQINEQLATREQNIRRGINSFQQLATEIGTKDRQLAQLVDSSNAVFKSFANQDSNLRATVRELPAALKDTQFALKQADTLADELGPTLQALRPGARDLGPALAATRPFLRETTPIIRDQIRPFTRQALPTLQQLRPAARTLNASTSDLVDTGKVLNRLLNELAYNPPGREEGYLFWASWVNHAGNSVFGGFDAHGPIRRGLLVLSCDTLSIVSGAAQANPTLATIVSQLDPPVDACPSSVGNEGSPTPEGTPGPGSGTDEPPAVPNPTLPTP